MYAGRYCKTLAHYSIEIADRLQISESTSPETLLSLRT
jgi:DNA-binding CsgD family transcriptional regulator